MEARLGSSWRDFAMGRGADTNGDDGAATQTALGPICWYVNRDNLGHHFSCSIFPMLRMCHLQLLLQSIQNMSCFPLSPWSSCLSFSVEECVHTSTGG